MYKIVFLFLFSTLWYSCTLFDNDQPIPAYLEINNVEVFTNESQGVNTHKITEVWAYANNQLLGVFEVPAKIPVLVSGETTNFSIFAGFRNNGIQSKSFIYQLLASEDFTEKVVPGDIIKKSLVFEYGENTKFDFVEDFEGNHIFTLDLDEDLETILVTTTEDVKSGDKSGKIEINEEHPFVSIGTLFTFDGDNNAGSDSYLELDYKNDVPFFVGLIYSDGSKSVRQPVILLNEKSEWNKIYIDYTEFLSDPDIKNYSIFIATDLESLNQTSGTIYLDNIKFVHL
ncbi:MAG: hypothetical protein V3V14_09265 [Saprospiraceae bacterium]